MQFKKNKTTHSFIKKKVPYDTFKLIDSVNKVSINPPTQKIINRFTEALVKAKFKGDTIQTSGDCSAWAADSSIYWIAPQLILQPKNHQQIRIILKIANREEFKLLSFTTRGGSTSTNGQSINYSVMIDTFKYLNNIISYNLKNDDEVEKFIEVESGITSLEINQFLKPFGYHFPIVISTGNRATIGGMIATNAAGRGSLVHGNTGDHLLSVFGYLAKGETFSFQNISIEQAKKIVQSQKPNWKIYQHLVLNQKSIEQLSEKKYPKLARGFSGYNLPKIFENGKINLTQLIAGSEGTLALVCRAKLKIYPINPYKKLIVVKYLNFYDALNHAQTLVNFKPHSIETMDENITRASQKLSLFNELHNLLTLNKQSCITNFIGIEAKSLEKLNTQISLITADLAKNQFNYELVSDKNTIAKLYKIREQSAAFFSAPIKHKSGTKTPVPFIEDCIVEPHNLSGFIKDFRELLNSYDLNYGFFGHIDVGVLHLRPALNLRETKNRQLVRKLTESLIKLLKKHNGLLWGEHGKGVRAEFNQALLGRDVVDIFNQIKQVFDPEEKLNPHKIAGNQKEKYLIDSLPIKDNLLNLPAANNGIWKNTLSCNGNGLCNSTEKSQTMCPSFKVSRDLRFSPKGRSNMLRSWLLSKEIYGSKRNAQFAKSFEKDLKHSLDYCLNCRACLSQCPLSVDIATMSEEFNSIYYKKHSRPMSDLLIKHIEEKAQFLVNNPRLSNILIHNSLAKSILKKMGLVDLPKVQINDSIKQLTNQLLKTDEILKQVDTMQNNVALLFDGLTSPYDWQNLLAAKKILELIGYQVYFVYDIASNKALKVRGMKTEFNKKAKISAEKLNKLHEKNIKVAGIDSAITHCFNSEYHNLLNFKVSPIAKVIEEKANKLKKLLKLNQSTSKQKYKIMTHCIEQTELSEVGISWSNIFSKLGLDVEIVHSGCCGMAGLFGHKRDQAEFSKKIYRTNWQTNLNPKKDEQILATGFSCRSQIKRIENKNIFHPLNLLAQKLTLN